MDDRKRILLYGRSVILESIGAGLAKSDRFQIIHLSSHLSRLSELEALDPDVVLFDEEDVHPEVAFSRLGTRPDLLILGLNPDTNIVRIWSGRQYRELSTTDLTHLIEDGSLPGAALGLESG